MMFGCAQSQEVLLRACIEKARMAPCRAYSYVRDLDGRHGDLISLFHTCMHSETRDMCHDCSVFMYAIVKEKPTCTSCIHACVSVHMRENKPMCVSCIHVFMYACVKVYVCHVLMSYVHVYMHKKPRCVRHAFIHTMKTRICASCIHACNVLCMHENPDVCVVHSFMHTCMKKSVYASNFSAN